ncbi:nitrite reductase large subunit NirB [Niallia oryzisoli]|uniref:Nitrite reductase large subunit NirB n=1 Tax=Niallia oryzisoli TaxID=1737571 RepID=A0ABZ2CI52_9BACI
MNKQRLVVIGNGMAGIRCLEEILEINPNLFTITVFGSEPHVNYNRILLSNVLQGSTSFENIMLNDREWYKKNMIELFTGETVVKIDTVRKIIQTDQKREAGFDKLIIATGSTPFVLPIPGRDKAGVITFRTIEDCQKMMEASKQYSKAAVIGGGLLGLEAARGLLNIGMEVDVVHLDDCLMNRQLDYTASKMLEKELKSQGMNFLLGKETEEIIGNHRVEGLRFKDGTEIKTELVVMAAGVKPNVKLAKESGIETNRAILVNDFLQTNIQDIYAVGECVEHRGKVYGLVKPLFEQGKVLAKHICGQEVQGYRGSVLSTQLKVSGVDVFSAGQFTGDETTKAISIQDGLNGVYKRFVFQGNKLVGAVLYGDTNGGAKLLKQIVEKKDIEDHEKNRLFQLTAVDENPVAAMAQSEIVCNCNAVTKGAILEAVQQNSLTTVEQVKKCTKASGSCGGCRPVVAQLLNYIQSDSFDEMIEKETLCSCTTMTEDEVIQEMQVRHLTSIQEAMNELNWKQPHGCRKCQGALYYYFGMIEPALTDVPAFCNKIDPIETYNGLCQCDRQSSLDLGVQLEKRWDFLNTPQRIKMSISSCIHNGEEVMTNDIGLIMMNRGWEIYIGGSGGRNTKAGDLFYVAGTNETVIDMVLSIIQYYRETANYLEYTRQWVNRIGLIHIREVIFDPELRYQLIKRLDLDVLTNKEKAEKKYIKSL